MNLPKSLLHALGSACEGILITGTTPSQRRKLQERGLLTKKGYVTPKGHRALAAGYDRTVAEIKALDNSRISR